jgi:hypothetical protein
MRGVLARPKFGFSADEIAGLLAMFRGQSDLIVPKGVDGRFGRSG